MRVSPTAQALLPDQGGWPRQFKFDGLPPVSLPFGPGGLTVLNSNPLHHPARKRGVLERLLHPAPVRLRSSPFQANRADVHTVIRSTRQPTLHQRQHLYPPRAGRHRYTPLSTHRPFALHTQGRYALLAFVDIDGTGGLSSHVGETVIR